MRDNVKEFSDIIPLYEHQIPTIISFDTENQELVIGHDARKIGLKGKTKAFNFKPELWEKTLKQIISPPLTDKRGQRPYWIRLDDNDHRKLKTFNAIDATQFFLEKIILNLDERPTQIIIGEPSVNEKQRDNFRKNIRHIFSNLHLKEPQFFPEPFAVFQYYTLIEKMFNRIEQSEFFLILDIGGGSFNSCIIKTTSNGLLSKGGASRLPLGLKADKAGGIIVDQEILKLIIEKTKKELNIKWKDDAYKRIMSNEIPVLMYIEDAKIEFSNKLKNVSINDDIKNITSSIYFKAGQFHPDVDVRVSITGEDLKNIIFKLREKWASIIQETIDEAEKKLGSKIDKIDKVIIAGGSSHLPFLQEAISNIFPHLINNNNIYFGKKVDNAVAYGIAAESREQAQKNTELRSDKIATCILSDLFVAFRENRNSDFIYPLSLSENGKIIKDGQLISSPFELGSLKRRYSGRFPFKLKDRLFIYFDNKPFSSDSKESWLNAGGYIYKIPPQFTKISLHFEIELKIDQDGTVTPSIFLFSKGRNKSKFEIGVSPFKLGNLVIQSGIPYIGIDFGTSNSYITKFLNIKEPEPQKLSNNYPEYVINPEIKDRLLKLEQDIIDWQSSNLLTSKNIINHAKNRRLLMVFHSNKLEGNPLSKGETALIIKEKLNQNFTKAQKEAQNMDIAYQWMLDNAKYCTESPEIFLREINKLLLQGINNEGGKYRTTNIKISGMKYTPPSHDSVSPFMLKLSKELKADKNGRSIIEFAAMMHTKLVSIHPFVDGNGRTARLLLNAILYSNRLPVILIHYDDRNRYLNALEETNSKNDISIFVDYIIECFYSSVYEIEEEFKININKIGPKISVKNLKLSEKDSLEDVDPLDSIIRKIISEDKNENSVERARYNSWASGINLLLSEINLIVLEYNKKYSFKGFIISFDKYDLPSFEKFMEIIEKKVVSKSWFGKLIFKHKNDKIELLLHFKKPSEIISENLYYQTLTVGINRFYNDTYYDLSNEPICIKEITYYDGQILFVDHEDKINSGNLNKTLKQLFADIIQLYFN